MATLIGETASHLTTRTQRRLLVVGFYLSLAGFVGLSTASHGSGAMVAAAGVLMLAGLVGYMLLMHLTHHSRTNPPSLLDERGVGVRDRAYHRAYRILTGMAAVALLYAWLAARTGMGWVPQTPRDWAALVAVACYLMSVLPASVIAWTEPDLLMDES
ncbi:MAG: hypothetical protein JO040_05310, partial [Gemmatimonadetes bacterium]|nr:hypothetical protein [Gemmatimonadota bacterium]